MRRSEQSSCRRSVSRPGESASCRRRRRCCFCCCCCSRCTPFLRIGTSAMNTRSATGFCNTSRMGKRSKWIQGDGLCPGRGHRPRGWFADLHPSGMGQRGVRSDWRRSLSTSWSPVCLSRLQLEWLTLGKVDSTDARAGRGGSHNVRRVFVYVPFRMVICQSTSSIPHVHVGWARRCQPVLCWRLRCTRGLPGSSNTDTFFNVHRQP